MSQRIRTEDIDRVREATDIVAVAEESLAVKRTRNLGWALCPFHQEKTPSFKMDSSTGLYHCFGCGASGNVFQFLERTQGMSFIEAVERLASRAGIQLRYEGKKQGEDRKTRLYEAVAAAVAFYKARLKEGSDAGGARKYLRSRGIGATEVDYFEIGFSPDSWDELGRHLNGAGFTERELIESGLCFRNDRGRLTDQFRGRIMFPIYDPSGRPIAFGARALGDAMPKYKNSATTRLYDKARTLYGLNWARSEMVAKGEVVVVEGYTDVIGLWQAGLGPAVATCGTALSEGHFDVLRRFAPSAGSPRHLQVILAFDADVAGAEAGERVFGLQHKFGFDVRVAILPDGMDPAECARDTREDLEKALRQAIPLVRFKIRNELSRYDMSIPEHRADALRAVATIVATYPDDLVRQEYAQEISESTGIAVDTVRAEIAKATQAGRHWTRPRSNRPSAPGVSAGAAGGGDVTGAAGTDIPAGAGSAGRRETPPTTDLEILTVLLHGSVESRSRLVRLGPDVITSSSGRNLFGCLARDPRPSLSALMDEIAGSPEAEVLARIAVDPPDPEVAERLEFEALAKAERILVERESKKWRSQLERTDLSEAEREEAGRKFSEAMRRLDELKRPYKPGEPRGGVPAN